VVRSGSLVGRTEVAKLYPHLVPQLAQVEAVLRQAAERHGSFATMAAREVISGRGKRLRPTLLLLAAECAGAADDSSIQLAAAAELVHCASLVHDDVVDEAYSRRGRRSANARWGNKVSVLLGDYLLARAVQIVPRWEVEQFAPELAAAAAAMSAGQIAELRAIGQPMSEAAYLEVARAKTGALFGLCGRAGAVSGGGSDDLADLLGRFGESFGIAFQFADDILDLVGTGGRSGKPEGRDVAERKFTLPLIVAAEIGGRRVEAVLTGALQPGVPLEEAVSRVRELVESTGAVEVSWSRVRAWLETARGELADVPDSEAKAALIALCGEMFPMPVMAVPQ
jgi:geranylgeranyl pyrophosphate synthase